MRIVFVFLSVSWMGFLGILGFVPNEYIHLPITDDKLLHALGFGVLAFLVYFCWELSSTKKNLVATFVPVFGMAVISECAQGLSPYRSFEGMDIVYNVLGLCIGLGASLLTEWMVELLKKLQSRWMRKSEDAYVPLEDLGERLV